MNSIFMYRNLLHCYVDVSSVLGNASYSALMQKMEEEATIVVSWYIFKLARTQKDTLLIKSNLIYKYFNGMHQDMRISHDEIL